MRMPSLLRAMRLPLPLKAAAKSAGDPVAAAEAVISDLAPIAWYKFDDGSGTQLTDYSGNDYHGTFGAGGSAPTWVSAGISFDGGDYITIPPINPSGNAVSILAVVLQPDTSGDEYFLMGGEVGASGYAWRMAFNDVGAEFAAAVSDDGTENATHFVNKHDDFIDFSANDNTWRTLAFTWSGTDLTLYGDGNALPGDAGAGGTANGLFDIVDDGMIGAFNNGGSPIAGFSGSIAYLLIFEGALTAQQVSDVHAALSTILADRSITLP